MGLLAMCMALLRGSLRFLHMVFSSPSKSMSDERNAHFREEAPVPEGEMMPANPGKEIRWPHMSTDTRLAMLAREVRAAARKVKELDPGEWDRLHTIDSELAAALEELLRARG